MFGLLLIPKGYYHLPFCNEATIQIVLNPFIMVSMMLMIFVTISPLGDTKTIYYQMVKINFKDAILINYDKRSRLYY